MDDEKNRDNSAHFCILVIRCNLLFLTANLKCRPSCPAAFRFVFIPALVAAEIHPAPGLEIAEKERKGPSE